MTMNRMKDLNSTMITFFQETKYKIYYQHFSFRLNWIKTSYFLLKLASKIALGWCSIETNDVLISSVKFWESKGLAEGTCQYYLLEIEKEKKDIHDVNIFLQVDHKSNSLELVALCFFSFVGL